jgi:hypothetical protein
MRRILALAACAVFVLSCGRDQARTSLDRAHHGALVTHTVTQGAGGDTARGFGDARAVFSRISPTLRPDVLKLLEGYCRERGIHRLDTNQVRLFVQPMGVVDKAIEIDLAAGMLTVRAGTHSLDAKTQSPLDSTQIARIKTLVTSEEFSQIRHENQRDGLDGTSYLLEASTDQGYFWALHWLPDDVLLLTAINEILALAPRR